MTVVYVQSYRRRGLSVNAEILFYIIWSVIYLTYFFVDFFISIFTAMHFKMISNAQILFSPSQFIHPALKNISALRRGFWRRVVRYVLSAKSHELGYSILINNSVFFAYPCTRLRL